MTFRTEREFQNAVCTAARALGLLVYHTHDSRRSEPGFPDLVIVGARGFIFRELKTDKGRMRPEQVAWIERLQLARADADVWRPSHWPTQVMAELREIA